VRVDIIRDGNPNAPLVLVEMAINDWQVFHLMSRICNFWHEGAIVSALVLNHCRPAETEVAPGI